MRFPSSRNGRWMLSAALSIAAFSAVSLLYTQDQASSAQTGSNPTAAVEALSGEELYKQNCMACHATDGAGIGRNPALVNDRFKKRYGAYDRAFAFISEKMPENAPGSLREEEYEAIVKYVLSLNGIPTDFSDIAGHWAEAAITALQRKQAVDGYTVNGSLLYKPDQPITRAEFVAYLVKAKQLFLSNDSGAEWKDIAKSKYKTHIVTAIEYGIVDGYPDSSFRPDKPISRAEIAAIVTRSEVLDTGDSASVSFRDVTVDHWAGGVIRAAVKAGLFNGYEDGTFRPDHSISRAEAAAVLNRIVP
ncbi:c-type cytochrome [Paenibacillus hemerocallicola]|uniref:C-type cytochrome n=1 Tax=Paenibacillus hemerocallicola TaxID=1172614 RepID=A0A5C4TDH3_9BACL|nr:cytochrome c [Paenibacillus hemerocallicola]TNJ67133.1 c-type cytochrome [Paenibacillus hemerocallicola]